MREVLGHVRRSTTHSGVLLNTSRVFWSVPSAINLHIAHWADKFSISFIKYNYHFKASFQFCSLQKCLKICARVLCALIKHAEYASFGQSERALYHSYFIKFPKACLSLFRWCQHILLIFFNCLIILLWFIINNESSN